MQLELNEDEARYLSDILQMWAEGIEEEVPRLANMPQDEVHWARFGLRKQLLVATQIKMRLDMERTKV